MKFLTVILMILLLTTTLACSEGDSLLNQSGDPTLAVTGLEHHSGTTLTAADIESGNAGTYYTTVDGHSHSFYISPSHIDQLKTGDSVTVTTSYEGDHDHTITFTYR